MQIPAIILIVFASLWLIYGIVNMFIGLSNGPPPPPPNQPPEFETGQKIGFYAAVFLLPIISLVVLVGAICMLKRTNYPLAMTGAIAGLIPCCGPCVVLAIPFAIWAIVLLLKPEVKASFT